MSKKLTLEFIKLEIESEGFMLLSESYENSNQKLQLRCPFGHNYRPVCWNKWQQGSRCTICSGREALEGFNDLVTTHPDLAKEWHTTENGNLKPQQVTAGSDKKVWWMCELGHEWDASVNSRSKVNGSGCPYCSGQRALEGFNDLVTTHPDLAKEWHPTENENLKPEQVTAGSGKKVWWVCKLGHEWDASVDKRSKGRGCGVCSGHKVLSGFNDLVTKNPDLAKEWNHEKNGDLKPEQVTTHSNKKVWWMCELGHKWDASVNNRSKVNGSGCPYCNESKGENKISKILKQLDIFYERERTFKDCKNKNRLPFDFYLPSHNLCIEYQGEQHYEVIKRSKSLAKNIEKFEKTKKNDKIKLDYCEANEINLLTISYVHFDNIEDIIKTYFTDRNALIKYSGVNLYTTQSVQKL